MVGSFVILLKKAFSLSLILNSLITVAAVAGVLFGFYRAIPYWQPYSPYLINGNFFWLAIAAALINIFPSASIGRALHTGRFLFHHYVYGFFVLLSSSVFVVTFTSVSLPRLFFVDTNNIAVNAGRIFLLSGLTLLIDDLPDVSKKVELCLNWLKTKAFHLKKGIHIFQLITGLTSLYCAISVILGTIQDPTRALPDSFLIGTLLVTSLTSFVCVKRKAWLKIKVP
jgi:hypothetical protein